MPRRLALSLCIAALFCLAAPAAKRPLTIKDFDSWNAIANQQLSRDGRYLIYAVFPQEGDGHVIVRNLATAAEYKEAAGVRPAPPPPNFASPNPEERPEPRGISVSFTQDGKYVVFSTFAAKADIDKAKKEKKSPEAMPKGGMVILDLTTGTSIRIADVKSFQVPEESSANLAYLKEGEAPAQPAGARRGAARRPEFGSPLVLRSFGTQAERTFPDVTEYALTKDGKMLAYAVASKQDDTNGVFSVDTAAGAQPVAALSGKGKYTRLVLDDKQDRLAFLSDKGDNGKFRIYVWDRKGKATTELVSKSTTGLHQGFLISDKAPLAFTKDGSRIFFGTAPPPPVVKEDDTPAEDKVSVDLWHWKDDHIQPMQKVRAEAERSRSFRAVYLIAQKKLVQLADENMTDINPNESGAYALGSDDREYRPMAEYDERYSDAYLVDTATGERKLVARKHMGSLTWAPDGRHALLFDGKNWNTISVPQGKMVNLTEKLPVKFWREDNDTPGRPTSYGSAGWTKDGKHVLLYDKFDIWQLTPDGSSAKNLTDGYGRDHHLQLRYVKLDPKEKTIDQAKPLLLLAEDQENFDTGFFVDRVDGTEIPKKLLMSNKTLSAPIKAKDADVLVLTSSTFEEFPDLQLTNSSFTGMKKISDANPQKADYSWGTSEMVEFRNADGVPLKAALYKPENFDPKKKYPMIVYLYEKLAQNVKHFTDPRPTNSINISFYVSNGYLVLTPDIVYNIGYPGPSAMKCVLPAVQAVVERGFVDEKNIGIQGHSWGGYQIAYMVTQTNMFKAAAPGAVVANMISAYDGIRWGPGIPRQFQYERTQSRIGGTLWEYPTRYILNSPIFQADRINTPLLMIHNDADDAVPWYQGIEFYLGLRRLGKEVYMFSYNGEPHNLRRRPNQKDYSTRMKEFFDYYLKGEPEPAWMKKGIPYLERDQQKGQTDQ